jgi:hypothetical protein
MSGINITGYGEIEIDPSREYLIITLPIDKLDAKKEIFLHRKQAFVTLEIEGLSANQMGGIVVEKIELLSEERRFTFMLDDTDLTRKKMAELSIFNDGSIYCRNIIRTPAEDKKQSGYHYKSVQEALGGDIMTGYLLQSLKERGLIK